MVRRLHNQVGNRVLLQNFKPLLGALLGTTGATAGPVWERGVEKFP